VERPQPQRFGDLQQAERRRNIPCNIGRECIGEPLLKQANRHLHGLGSCDDLGDHGIRLCFGHAVPYPGIRDADLRLHQQ